MANRFLKQDNGIMINFTMAALLLFIYFLPYLILGKDSYVMVHDNLDQINMLGIFEGEFRGHFFLNDNIEEYYMPGIFPGFYLGGIYINKFFYWSFGYFWGFVVNEIVYRVIAFSGFFILFKRLRGDKQFPELLIILLAFSFVTLPFWPQGGLSVAGIPLVIILFHNLYRKSNLFWSYAILFLYAFYSGISLSGIFILILMVPVILYLFIREKKVPKGLVLGAFLLCGGYVLCNTNLFLMQFIYKIPTNRTDMTVAGVGILDALNNSIKMLIYSQNHALSNHTYIIIPSLVGFFLYFFLRKFTRGSRKYLWYKGIFIVLALFYIVAAALIYGFFLYEPLLEIYNKLHLGFNFSRFYFLSPALWFLLWGLVLLNYYLNTKKKTLAFIVIMVLLLSQCLYNYKNFIYGFRTKATFNEMVSEKQFGEIKNKLRLTGADRIGCIGFFPSIANYNGLKTLGAYRSVYPRKFKEKFYEIVKMELLKNNDLHDYFINWGSRAYLFDDKIGFKYSKQNYIRKNIPVITCELDVAKMKDLGVTKLFSTSRITNEKERNMALIHISDAPGYYYKLFIYALN